MGLAIAHFAGNRVAQAAREYEELVPLFEILTNKGTISFNVVWRVRR
jgi:hypothetical protein